MFSHPELMEGVRCGRARQAREFPEDAMQVEAVIEQVLDLGEIAVRVLCEAEGVVGADQCCFEVAQQGVDGPER